MLRIVIEQYKGFIMKKLIYILVLAGVAVFLAGCSGLPNINLQQLIATPTSPPPVRTPTPFASETPIPTQNLFATSTSTPLTFTPTVTSIGAELFTPTNTATSFPTPGLPPAAVSGSYFTPQNTGFLTILISNNTIYWNAGPCTPRNIKVSAFVEDLINTDRVVLFMRLREKKNTLNVTEWGAGALMIKEDNGSFNYNVRTFNIRRYYYFRDAWLEYQLVALAEDNQVIARTQIYDRNISLVRCQPVP
jgi:hypothetical protein